MVETILEIVLVGLKFLDRADQEKIKDKILDLRSKYAAEMSHSFRPLEANENFDENSRPVDNARLYSIERELRDILQLYRTAVEGAQAPSEPK